MSNQTFDFEPERLEEFIEKYLELDRHAQRPNGVFSILPGPREEKYQYMLKYFLDPQKPHGFGDTLLEAFFKCIGFHEYNLSGQHIEIDDEVWTADTGSNSRIDLIISGGNALVDHPRWAVLIELKVGADEGQQQTTSYANTETWNVSWFESDTLSVERLEESKYVYVKREAADEPDDDTETFESVSWADIVNHFEEVSQQSMFNFPNRSVIQLTDFIQALKTTENMDSSIDEGELNERLNLYFEYKDLIQEVQQANSQFETDFEDLSTYLRDNWEQKLLNKYDFEGSGWQTSVSSNPKWQKIRPQSWGQDPLDQSSTIELFYRHSPTTDCLREQVLRFRLRLPPARRVHTQHGESTSFNELFTEKCTEEIKDAAEVIEADETRLGSASALIIKEYELDPDNLIESYFSQLDTAVAEFCGPQTELPTIINSIFEETYQEVFEKEPVGEYQGPLTERE